MDSINVVNSNMISNEFTIFIDLNTILKKLCLMLKDDSKSSIELTNAVSNFQELFDIRMAVIIRLMSVNVISNCKTLKKQIDDILDEVKELITSGHKNDAITTLEKIKFFKNNEYINYFKFETLKEEASKQIKTISINTVKMLASASIYVMKLRTEYNKFVDEDDTYTYNDIVELINNYYIVIIERNKMVVNSDLNIDLSEDKKKYRNEYIDKLEKLHELVKSDKNKNTLKKELGIFVSTLIPSALSTQSMVILVDGVVESIKDSLY